jgi:para-nitrobenzyl esterase
MKRALVVALVLVLPLLACRRRAAPGAAMTSGASATAVPEDKNAPTRDVTTDHGVVRGVVHGPSYAYRGIPYAAPPTGARRFRAPEDAARWNAPRDVRDFGACCPQADADGKVEGAEDCLTLNVWTPRDAAPAPRAVLVFVHGGGNIQGCAAQINMGQRIYEGDGMAARENVVVVTINYRLGALGFLAHPALSAEGTPHASGNYGLRDQAAALRWVHANIAAFGGDPARVLLFGESAGAEDTCAHLVSPRSKGLFSRALMESALCPTEKLADAETQGADVARKVGCVGGDVAACLRAKTPEDFVHDAPGASLFQKGVKYGPVVDGDVITRPPLETIASGAHHHVPFAIGDNSEETLLWFKNKPLPGEAAYRLAMHELLGREKGDKALARYPANAYPDAKSAFVAATSDAVFICPARSLARALAKGQSEPVFRYLFTHAAQQKRHAATGAAHGVELLFVFGHLRLGGYTPTAGEEALSASIMGYWTRFAAAGDPNGGSAVSWPRFDVTSDAYLKLDETIAADERLHTEHCDFWDGLGPTR